MTDLNQSVLKPINSLNKVILQTLFDAPDHKQGMRSISVNDYEEYNIQNTQVQKQIDQKQIDKDCDLVYFQLTYFLFRVITIMIGDGWNNQTNITQAKIFKQQGNVHFKQQNYKQSLRAYHKALLHLAGVIDKNSSVSIYSKQVASEAMAQQSNDLKFSLYLNMGQIYIYQGKFQKGIQVLGKAKAIKVTAKLRYRLGVCLMRFRDFDRAQIQFQAVVVSDPATKEQINKLRQEMKVLRKQDDAKSKSFFKNIFK